MKKKPGIIRAIVILAILQVLICLAFYIIFQIKEPSLPGISSDLIFKTLLGYTALSVPIIFFALKGQAWPMRIALLLDVAVSLPAKAFIGIVLSTVALILSFTKGAKKYFSNPQE